jgi:hypothetical protein
MLEKIKGVKCIYLIFFHPISQRLMNFKIVLTTQWDQRENKWLIRLNHWQNNAPNRPPLALF